MDNTDRSLTHPVSAGVDTATAVDPKLRAFMIGVYNKVALGLLVSAGLAYLTSSVPAVRDLLFKTTPDTGRFIGLTGLGAATVLSPLIAMIGFGMKAQLSAARARVLYWSIVTTIGASLGVTVLVYTTTSVATAFAASAAGFGALSLWGYCTERNLSAVGSFWVTGLVGLLMVIGLNIFLQSPIIGFAVNAVGVTIFAGLIAHDTQRLKSFYQVSQHDTGAMSAAADLGALSLYLDFINLFQFLLALIGGRR
ncbi:MAG: Bax inhibitor-1/YccA family protein [Phenylobacterium sp.]|uniref:Bax inhibitor-1/YccA family protein n=1 Tax=Phenylobacterium sp. TaxID=1871053 RepID=UPI0027368481|nr:Bax inhibitor-1/YccA family protein [Phenylobacterium sp.]MDP3173335.1 Bax inhibitor-1/YccA family protein [Phenylobacterium sp.]